MEEEQEAKVVVTWAEEVDEAEEKGVNVFAPEMSVLPHTVFVTSASPENKATGAASTQRRMTACQRRRARRRARDAALNAKLESHASAENEAVKTMNSEAVNTMNNDRPTDNSSSEAVHSGTTATRRCRGRRRKAAAATNNSHVWPSPSVRVYGSDGLPFVTTWEEAAYGAFHAQRHR